MAGPAQQPIMKLSVLSPQEVSGSGWGNRCQLWPRPKSVLSLLQGQKDPILEHKGPGQGQSPLSSWQKQGHHVWTLLTMVARGGSHLHGLLGPEFSRDCKKCWACGTEMGNTLAHTHTPHVHSA